VCSILTRPLDVVLLVRYPLVAVDCEGHRRGAADSCAGPRPWRLWRTVFIFDGARVQNDVYLGAQIGEYWNSTVTGGRGIYHNCNAKNDHYQKLGIGMICYHDAEKIAVFKSEVLGYLCKDSQSIRAVVSENEQCFGRGELPRRTSNAWRPRLFDCV